MSIITTLDTKSKKLIIGRYLDYLNSRISQICREMGIDPNLPSEGIEGKVDHLWGNADYLKFLLANRELAKRKINSLV